MQGAGFTHRCTGGRGRDRVRFGGRGGGRPGWGRGWSSCGGQGLGANTPGAFAEGVFGAHKILAGAVSDDGSADKYEGVLVVKPQPPRRLRVLGRQHRVRADSPKDCACLGMGQGGGFRWRDI